VDATCRQRSPATVPRFSRSRVSPTGIRWASSGGIQRRTCSRGPPVARLDRCVCRPHLWSALAVDCRRDGIPLLSVHAGDSISRTGDWIRRARRCQRRFRRRCRVGNSRRAALDYYQSLAGCSSTPRRRPSRIISPRALCSPASTGRARGRFLSRRSVLGVLASRRSSASLPP
jgi:hypothetical protein